MKKSSHVRDDLARCRRIRRRRVLEIILDAEADNMQQIYIRESRFWFNIDDRLSDASGSRMQYDEHAAIWLHMAKTMLLRGLDPVTYIRAAITKQPNGATVTPRMLLAPALLSDFRYVARAFARQLDVALASQHSFLESAIHWQEELYKEFVDSNFSRRTVISMCLRDEVISASALFRYCIGHREGITDVCREFGVAAIAQYMRHPAEYDHAWGDFIPAVLKREGKALRKMLVAKGKS